MTMYQQALFGAPQTALTTDDYYTPKWIFDRLGLVFDIDVASPPNGPPFTPCKSYFTMMDDGLAQPWHGIVWMNPPFSNIKPWVHRFLEHNNGMALLPMANNWHGVEMFEHPNTDVLLLHDPGRDRLKFHRGDKMVEIRFQVFLYAMGDQCKTALKRLGRSR